MEYLNSRKNILEVKTNLKFNIELLEKVLRERQTSLRFINKWMFVDVLKYLELLSRFPQHEIEISFKNFKKLDFNDFKNHYT